MTGGALASTAGTLEMMFAAQFESLLATETKALSDALGAGLTDTEIATAAAAERKLIFAGLNTIIAKATNPATSPTK